MPLLQWSRKIGAASRRLASPGHNRGSHPGPDRGPRGSHMTTQTQPCATAETRNYTMRIFCGLLNNAVWAQWYTDTHSHAHFFSVVVLRFTFLRTAHTSALAWFKVGLKSHSTKASSADSRTRAIVWQYDDTPCKHRL